MRSATRRRSRTGRRSGCPIGIALDLFGDPWTLLIVRDLMFKDRNTYNQFLASGEGVTTTLLADRLARLVADGLVEAEPDPFDGRKIRYELTEKGIALAPLLVEMVLWSAEHERTDAPPEVVAFMKSDKSRFLEDVRSAWKTRRGARGRLQHDRIQNTN